MMRLIVAVSALIAVIVSGSSSARFRALPAARPSVYVCVSTEENKWTCDGVGPGDGAGSSRQGSTGPVVQSPVAEPALISGVS